jgi:hypothetical protein
MKAYEGFLANQKRVAVTMAQSRATCVPCSHTPFKCNNSTNARDNARQHVYNIDAKTNIYLFIFFSKTLKIRGNFILDPEKIFQNSKLSIYTPKLSISINLLYPSDFKL